MDTLPSEHFPLIDAVDHDILMHREAHFGGLFSEMLDYYRAEGKGIQPEFDLKRIELLAELEKQMKENLAPLFLTGEEAEKVAAAREAYKKLRTIYEVKKTQTYIPKMIADLIFAEEEEPQKEIDALVNAKEQSISYLIDLLRKEEFYNPLFPGYGQAPFLAAKTLGLIGDKRALISLFEAMGQGDFFADEQIVKAFHAIGIAARDFLLTIVKGKPLNEDNERAAIALIAFKEDEKVANTCLELIQQSEVQKDFCLTTYLILSCEGLKERSSQQKFIELSQTPLFLKNFKEDMKSIVQSWS